MANKDTSKQWFKTGDYPTQGQFYQLFDWLRWIDQKIPIGDVDGLATILNGIATISSIKALYRTELSLTANGTFNCNAGMAITGIILKSTNGDVVSIGTSDGGGDVAEDIELQAGVSLAISTIFYTETTKQIYFTGINGPTDIILLTNPKL